MSTYFLHLIARHAIVFRNRLATYFSIKCRTDANRCFAFEIYEIWTIFSPVAILPTQLVKFISTTTTHVITSYRPGIFIMIMCENIHLMAIILVL